MTLGDYVSQKSILIARSTLDGIESGRLRTFEDVDAHVTAHLGDVTDELKALATGTASPMMQSAVAAMKPAIMEALQDYTPTFAAVSGGMLALAVLLGVWVAKPDTFERWFR